ncbi:hypothetical protein FQA39_LY00096 [Lamprigera yunnana]|nr:hypothetical protein FQA39_LY00096 [Lamprigera yunnana]
MAENEPPKCDHTNRNCELLGQDFFSSPIIKTALNGYGFFLSSMTTDVDLETAPAPPPKLTGTLKTESSPGCSWMTNSPTRAIKKGQNAIISL